ncbi:MAG: helix-turn-helix domain-containing protein [Provencibacterium sp.]|jgi:transposase|nr:helix-turn-helix domain-containing protein [Provencibacterium sp.]
MPAPLKYNAQYHDAWAWSLAIKGATDKEVAAAFGVTQRTINRWKKDYPSFLEALQAGKDAADAQIELSLYKRARGYDYDETEKIIEVNKDGSSKLARIRTVSKHVPSDTLAMMYWLNNRRRNEWSQRQDINVTGEIRGVDMSDLTDDELRALAHSEMQKDDSG